MCRYSIPVTQLPEQQPDIESVEPADRDQASENALPMTVIDAPDVDASEGAAPDVAAPVVPLDRARRRSRRRVARVQRVDADLARHTARIARALMAWLILVFSIDVLLIAARAPLGPGLAGAITATGIFLVTFRLERRNITFARLSGIAQFVYRTRAVVRGAVGLAAVAFFVPWLEISSVEVMLLSVIVYVVGLVWGYVTRWIFAGTEVSRTLIIGDGERVGKFIAEFAADPHPQYKIVGYLTETTSDGSDDVDDETTLGEIVAMFGEAEIVPIGQRLGNIDTLENVIENEHIDTVVVAVRRNRLQLFSRLSNCDREIAVQELPAFSEHVFGRVPVEQINAAWFMHLIHPFYRPYSRILKRSTDMLMAGIISLFAAPVVPLAALAVRLSGPGPILYSQVRVGENGREFRIYKFRTMVQDAEKGGAQWAQKNDPRVTPIGKLFRSTRIDEIPQLWNILRGNMSFVGPRPERPEFVAELEESVPYYRRRHMVKPGLTGWAQVRASYTDSVDGAAEKLGYELYYLKHQSLFLDFLIFLETIRVVFLRVGSR